MSTVDFCGLFPCRTARHIQISMQNQKEIDQAMRQSGVLLHITSLPGAEGIGTMGKSAHAFIDFLSESGCGIWQVLPVGPTGYGDSPYQSPSCYAGNPLLIDLQMLEDEGILPPGSLQKHPEAPYVDFPAVIQEKEKLLRLAYQTGYASLKKEVQSFIKTHEWVKPYARYCALQQKFGYFYDWPVFLRRYYKDKNEQAAQVIDSLRNAVSYHAFVQFLFDRQWNMLKKHAEEKNIRLFGDMPIYVAPGSCDIWTNPDLFQLDEDLNPQRVAGVPPDYFSEDGQLWGNPLYDWDKMRLDGYQWWIQRLKGMQERFHIVRIDHFIGFANYYSIPADAKTAKIGEWIPNDGQALFRQIKKQLPDLRIIAEDLGVVSDRVKKLLKYVGYPGMRVLVFGFSGGDDNPHRPQNFRKNCVIYTATHDNDTSLGWWLQASDWEKKTAREILHLKEHSDVALAMVRRVFSSRAETVIVPLQDLLGLDNAARMNTPGTCGGLNWRYRVTGMPFTERLKKKIIRLNKSSRRGAYALQDGEKA